MNHVIATIAYLTLSPCLILSGCAAQSTPAPPEDWSEAIHYGKNGAFSRVQFIGDTATELSGISSAGKVFQVQLKQSQDDSPPVIPPADNLDLCDQLWELCDIPDEYRHRNDSASGCRYFQGMVSAGWSSPQGAMHHVSWNLGKNTIDCKDFYAHDWYHDWVPRSVPLAELPQEWDAEVLRERLRNKRVIDGELVPDDSSEPSEITVTASEVERMAQKLAAEGIVLPSALQEAVVWAKQNPEAAITISIAGLVGGVVLVALICVATGVWICAGAGLLGGSALGSSAAAVALLIGLYVALYGIDAAIT